MPAKPPRKSLAGPPVAVLAVGAGGIEELHEQLDAGMVCWAILRFQVGSGAFARTKFVAIHFNGNEVQTMRRAHLNARSKDVLGELGKVHATITLESVDEVSVSCLCDRLVPFFVDDSGIEGASSSAESLRQSYEAEIARRRRLTRKKSSIKSSESLTAKEKGGRPITSDQAVSAVGAKQGPYNWVLLEPIALELHNAGYGGLLEMKTWLAEDKVLFGAVRFTFGWIEGSKIVKHIFVHWVGPKTSAVRRGKWNERRKAADDKVGDQCVLALRKVAHALEDLDLEDTIKELRRLTILDGMSTEHNSDAEKISVEEYLKALEKEREEQMVLEEETECEEEAAPPLPNVKTAVSTVRTEGGGWNWALLGFELPPGGHSQSDAKVEEAAQGVPHVQITAAPPEAEPPAAAKKIPSMVEAARARREKSASPAPGTRTRSPAPPSPRWQRAGFAAIAVAEAAPQSKERDLEEKAEEAAKAAKEVEEKRKLEEAERQAKEAAEVEAAHAVDAKAQAEREASEEERKAREAAEEERKVREAAEEERKAREAAEEERKVREAAEGERKAREAAEEERKVREVAEEERKAREAAEEERRVREVAEEERKAREAAEEERVAQEAAEEERKAREAAEEERKARETAEEERKAREAAEEERKAREAAEEERKAVEAAEQERKAQEAAEEERRVRKAAEEERQAQEAAELERKAQEAREEERRAREAAEQERNALEAAEKERKAQEAAEEERKAQELAERERKEQERAEEELKARETAEQTRKVQEAAEEAAKDAKPVKQETELAKEAEANQKADLPGKSSGILAERKPSSHERKSRSKSVSFAADLHDSETADLHDSESTMNAGSITAVASSESTVVAAPDDATGVWTIEIDRAAGGELGIDLDYTSLRINMLRDRGLVIQYNQAHPSSAVCAGDMILEVNGKTGAGVLSECVQRQMLKIKLGRGIQQEHKMTSTEFTLIADENVDRMGWASSGLPPQRVFVSQVMPSSWGSQQGLRAGDEVQSVSGKLIREMHQQEFLEAVKRRPLKLVYLRWTDSSTSLAGSFAGSASTSFGASSVGSLPGAQGETFTVRADEGTGSLGWLSLGLPPQRVFVSEIDSNSWAAKSGMRLQDELIKLDDEPISQFSANVFVQAVSRRPLRFTFMRHQSPVEAQASAMSSSRSAAARASQVPVNPNRYSHIVVNMPMWQDWAGELRLKTGWSWRRRYFQLSKCCFRWWASRDDYCKKPPEEPMGQVTLVDQNCRWTVKGLSGSRFELVYEQEPQARQIPPPIERYELLADDNRAATDCARNLWHHVRYIDMLAYWPMPLDGRQSDLRCYGIDYPSS